MNRLIYMGSQESTTYGYKMHSHRHWEITYYMEGDGVNITDGVKYPFSTGTIVCQPPFVEHQDVSLKGYKNIFFEVDSFNSNSKEPIIIRDTEDKNFLALIRQMYQEYFTENDEMIIDALMNVINIYMHRRLHTENNSPMADILRNEIIFNYANHGYQILETIKRLPISESQIRRAFKKETGVTPQMYLQSMRLEHARKLLLNDTVTIVQIADMCGYDDPCYFSRIFKKRYGVSPKEWRNAQLSE